MPNKPASPISRSVYQKLAEENKRLKADIYSLVMIDTEKEDSMDRWIEVTSRWEEKFEKDAEFRRLLHEYAVQYFKDNPDKLIKQPHEPDNRH